MSGYLGENPAADPAWYANQELRPEIKAGDEELKRNIDEVEEASNDAEADLDWLSYVRSEAEMQSARQLVRDTTKASGYSCFGNSFTGAASNVSINKGIWTETTASNALHYGADPALAVTGDEDYNYPVLSIAGIVSRLLGSNSMYGRVYNRYKFSDAPNGTIVADTSGNCRGSGKTTLDLTKDIDPKYGDVASTHEEALARAFEGLVPQDFRKGALGFNTSTTATILDNKAVFSGGGFKNLHGKIPYVTGQYYRVELTLSAASNVNAFLYHGNSTDYTSISATAGETKVDVTFEAKNTSVFNFGSAGVFEVISIKVTKVTEEVVINRVDMFGREVFLEELGENVYPNGDIHCKLSGNVDGVPVSPGSRPVTYYAVYKGDDSSIGNSWKWSTLTRAQRKLIVSNPFNNIFKLKDGRLVQWRVRQRTEEGTINGDWSVISSATSGILSSTAKRQVRVQGSQDTPVDTGDIVTTPYFYGYLNSGVTYSEKGAFSASYNTGSAVPEVGISGECYFYVDGTVTRLNQGAHHPSYNPLGTAHFRDQRSENTALKWSDDGMDLLVTSEYDCFRHVTNNAGYDGSVGGTSARDDERFYDVIYDGGLGGVIDYRLPSRDMSSTEDAYTVFQDVSEGRYRGKEYMQFTYVLPPRTIQGDSIGDIATVNTNKHRFKISDGSLSKPVLVGDTIYVNGKPYIVKYLEPGVPVQGEFYTPIDTTGMVQQGSAAGWYTYSGQVRTVHSTSTNIPVSGYCTKVDALGDPQDIYDNLDLRAGWLGGWSMDIPDETGYTSMMLTRKQVSRLSNNLVYKAINSPIDGPWTTFNVGEGSSTNQLNTITNKLLVGVQIGLYSYISAARPTKPSSRKRVYGGQGGVSSRVWCSSTFHFAWGCLLNESLLGKVTTSNDSPTSGEAHGTVSLESCVIRSDTGLVHDYKQYAPKHSPITLTKPDNDSSAVKAMWHQSSENSLMTLNFNFNELRWTKLINIQDINAGSSFSVNPGDTRRLNGFFNPSVNGQIVRFADSVTGTWKTDAFNDYNVVEGEFHDIGGGIYDKRMRVAVYGHEWGDDSTILIKDGLGTYINLVGTECTYGTHELALPYGHC